MSGVLAGDRRSARRAWGSLDQGWGARATARAQTTSSGALPIGRTCGRCSQLVRFPPHKEEVRALVGGEGSCERRVTPAAAAERVVD